MPVSLGKGFKFISGAAAGSPLPFPPVGGSKVPKLFSSTFERSVESSRRHLYGFSNGREWTGTVVSAVCCASISSVRVLLVHGLLVPCF